jgi:hypothetical protein
MEGINMSDSGSGFVQDYAYEPQIAKTTNRNAKGEFSWH